MNKKDETDLTQRLRNSSISRVNDIFTIIEDGEPSKDLNKAFGIPDVFVLTPGRKSIENFAAMNYLFSLFGIKVQSFTSCKNGYVATFVNENDEPYGTFFTGDSQVLLEEFYKLAEANGREDLIEKSEGKSSLIEICKEISKTEPKQEESNEFIENFGDVNGNNCSDNHKILCNILCDDHEKKLRDKLLAIRNIDLLSEESEELDTEGIKAIAESLRQKLAEEQDEKKKEEIRKKFTGYEVLLADEELMPELLKKKKLFDNILYGNIIQGYFTFMGKNREGRDVPQDGMILDRKDLVLKIARLLGYKSGDFLGENTKKANNAIERVKKLVYCINMASTDYNADVVQSIFGKLLAGEEIDLNSIVPPGEKPKEAISLKAKKKYAHLGPNREHIATVFDDER